MEKSKSKNVLENILIGTGLLALSVIIDLSPEIAQTENIPSFMRSYALSNCERPMIAEITSFGAMFGATIFYVLATITSFQKEKPFYKDKNKSIEPKYF